MWKQNPDGATKNLHSLYVWSELFKSCEDEVQLRKSFSLIIILRSVRGLFPRQRTLTRGRARAQTDNRSNGFKTNPKRLRGEYTKRLNFALKKQSLLIVKHGEAFIGVHISSKTEEVDTKHSYLPCQIFKKILKDVLEGPSQFENMKK